jgi:hypothetical protein
MRISYLFRVFKLDHGITAVGKGPHATCLPNFVHNWSKENRQNIQRHAMNTNSNTAVR